MAAAEAARLTALEISAQGMALAEALALRVGRDGGAALVVDYGQDGPYGDSLVALKAHGPVHPLAAPGTADLSARVDFGALAAAVSEVAGAKPHGPITQAALLGGLGLTARLEALAAAAADDDAVDALVAGATRLVAPDAEGGMGDTYAALAIAPVGRAPVPF